jgi:carbonic anhydrase
LEKQGLLKDYDLVCLAGSQKSFLDNDTQPAALKQLNISSRLHEVKRVILVAHQDCGAYGGSKTFASLDEEFQRYTTDLNATETLIKEKHPNLEVKKFIAKFGEAENIVLEEY